MMRPIPSPVFSSSSGQVWTTNRITDPTPPIVCQRSPSGCESWRLRATRIVENQLRGFEAQSMVALVGAVLGLGPSPEHFAASCCNYVSVATKWGGVNLSIQTLSDWAPESRFLALLRNDKF